MVLESAQILSTVVQGYDIETTYKATHVNHPCTKWAAFNTSNFNWLREHGIALADEYTLRYNKFHRVSELFWTELLAPSAMPCGALSPFAQAMPEQYKHKDAVIAYRQYYINEKAYFCKWKYREPPDWFVLKDPYHGR